MLLPAPNPPILYKLGELGDSIAATMPFPVRVDRFRDDGGAACAGRHGSAAQPPSLFPPVLSIHDENQPNQPKCRSMNYLRAKPSFSNQAQSRLIKANQVIFPCHIE
jgi:hypothetical protein